MKELVLHIGMMKTATTYLQGVLQNNREELAKQGWLYPGKHLNHQREVYGLCGKNVYWYRKVLERDVELGKSLVEEIKETPHSVIVSSEALSSLSSEGIKKIVEKVGCPVRVVVTVRSLYKVLPSAWQQYVKGGSTRSFEQMLDKFIQSREDLSGPWRTYAYGNIVKKWSEVADVHTVVIPITKKEGEPTTWDLFQKACGLPNVSNTNVPASQANISLPIEGVNFLVEVNKVLENKYKLGAAEKVSILNSYLRSQAYPASGKVKGNIISAPSDYIKQISAWDKAEVDLLECYSSQVYGKVNNLITYADGQGENPGNWTSSSEDMLVYLAEQVVFNNK